MIWPRRQYDESTQIGYWIFDVFAQASGPVKAFAFLTMVKSEKMEMSRSRFGEKDSRHDVMKLLDHVWRGGVGNARVFVDCN